MRPEARSCLLGRLPEGHSSGRGSQGDGGRCNAKAVAANTPKEWAGGVINCLDGVGGGRLARGKGKGSTGAASTHGSGGHGSTDNIARGVADRKSDGPLIHRARGAGDSGREV